MNPDALQRTYLDAYRWMLLARIAEERLARLPGAASPTDATA